MGDAMGSLWLVVYLTLAAAAIVQSALLALQSWEHRRFARSCMRDLDRHQATGRAAVIVPCKGVDVELEANLRALLHQDYGAYEVTFVVESAEDEAVDVIRRVISQHPQAAARLVVAGKANHSGQKVHNLRMATADLSPQVEYLAFVDTDARPKPHWLRVLVARLSAPGVGAVTGYRWFLPTRASLANYLIYSANCGVMVLFGRTSHYFVWGGSWGIRRDVFDSIGLRDAWQRTLSDDLVATRRLRRAGAPVQFEPACVVGSPVDFSFREMLSFVRRQYIVGRFYAAWGWAMALVASTPTCLAWLAGLATLGWSLACGSPAAWIPASLLSTQYLLTLFRGAVRQSLIRTYFSDKQRTLRGARLFDVLANPLGGFLCWLGMLGSMFGRQIHWRGISYRVASGGEIRAVWRDEEPLLSLIQHERCPQADTAAGHTYRKVG